MNPEISKDTRIGRAANIVSSRMDDEYLLMSVDLSDYIALRNVSARIWELLEQPRTMADLQTALLAEYTVAQEVCDREVSGFLQQMLENSLLALEPPV